MFTAVLTAVLTSAFWIWFYNFVPSKAAAVERSGNIVAVVPPHSAPVVVSQQVEVGPAGLAIPVVGIKATQLSDTFTQARGQVIAQVGHTGDASAAGPHLHFAVNRMAPGERWWDGTPINPYPLLAGK